MSRGEGEGWGADFALMFLRGTCDLLQKLHNSLEVSVAHVMDSGGECECERRMSH